VDFTSLTSFKRTINDVDYNDFLKFFFHSNVIIQCLMSVLVLSHCTAPPPLWAVISAVVAFMTLRAHVFIVHMLCFLCFLHCGCDVLPK